MSVDSAAWRPVRPGLFAAAPDGAVPSALLASRCGGCGTVSFPSETICPGCFRSDVITPFRLSGRGTLYSYSIVRSAPPGFTAPYAVGYVDLAEGVRLFAPIVVDRFEDLSIGMPVELAVAPVRRDGAVDVIGYTFRPVRR